MALYGYLYKIENLNNHKVYIGKTYKSIHERFEEHLKNAYEKKEQSKLYNDMRLYGRQTFELTLIGSFPKTELEYQEVQYIKKYNSWQNGYNQSVGGEGFIKNDYSEDINSLYQQGVKVEDISKRFKISQEKVRRILYRTNKDYIKNAKEIAEYDENGDYLKKYSCIEEIVELEGLDFKEILSALKKHNPIQGHIFSYDCPF